MKRLNQTGSHIIAVAVGILVIGIVAFAGYTVANKDDAPTNTNGTTQYNKSSGITNNADLSAAGAELDSSTTQLDGSLNDSSLDADLNDLL